MKRLRWQIKELLSFCLAVVWLSTIKGLMWGILVLSGTLVVLTRQLEKAGLNNRLVNAIQNWASREVEVGFFYLPYIKP